MLPERRGYRSAEDKQAVSRRIEIAIGCIKGNESPEFAALLLGPHALSRHRGVIRVICVIRTPPACPIVISTIGDRSAGVLLSAASGSRQRLQRPPWQFVIATAQAGQGAMTRMNLDRFACADDSLLHEP